MPEEGVIEMPIYKKLTLSVEEASLYSGIGVNTLYTLMKKPEYDLVIWIGKKKRIKRKSLEELVNSATMLDI